MFAFLKKGKIRKKALLVFLFTILVLTGSFFVYKYTKASYAVISFTEVGPHTWVIPDGAISADILIVAGGGGGGYRHGAGGGAGGLIFKENYSLTPGSSITINVGAGGKGATGSSAATRSTNGGDSSFDSFIAIGGGAAGQWDAYLSGSSGGSGGGSASNYKASGTAGQGNSGGGLLSNYKHGGGGGAGEAGTDGTADSNGMGGKGLYYGNIFGDDYGENGWFAGGGGGGSHNPAPLNRGLGGLGGGGNGGTPSTYQNGDNGLPNTGGGGGGASTISGGTNRGGDGGSGVVIIRYKLKPGTAKGIQTYSGLVGYWTLDEKDYNISNSKVTDKSPFENHGANSGATFSSDRFGKEGGAMSFVGNNLNFSKNHSFDSGSFSISMWGYHRNYTYPRTFGPIKKSSPNCYQSGGLGWDFGHTYSSSGVDVCFNDGVNLVRRILTFNVGSRPPDFLNKWVHIVYVINRGSGRVSIYLDGVKQNDEVDISLLGNIQNNNDLVLGNLYGWYNDGLVDDLRIYNRALSAEEIKSLYNSYSPKTTTGSLEQGLILDMPLKSKYTKSETAGSQIMTDRTAYSRDGQNSGATITEEGASFNGSNYYHIKTINNILLDDSQVYSAWVKVPAVDGALRGVLTTHNHAQTSNLGINIINSKFYVSIGYADGTREYSSKGTSFSITPNEWVHVALVYNKSENSVQFYVNGDPNNKWTLTKNVKFTSEKISVGIWSTTYSGYLYNGQISNVLIYNRALSEDEVKTLYNRGRSDVGIMFQTKN